MEVVNDAAYLLTVTERENMATFLQHVVYPPARSRMNESTSGMGTPAVSE